MKKISTLGCAILSCITTLAQADTCKPNNESYPFRQVVLGEGALRCDYGKEFDFNHSYTLYGNYKPSSGPWSGSAEPDMVFCRSEDSNFCVFVMKKK